LTTKNVDAFAARVCVGNTRIGRALWRGRIHSLARWAHIYLSVVGFLIILFFSATGLTLNHPEWFAESSRTTNLRGALPHEILAPLSAGKTMPAVEWLQRVHHLRGRLHDTQCDSSQCTLSLRAPGYSADVFVDATTGQYSATVVSNGWLATLNDLHRGRDAGAVWSHALDAAAVLLILVSFTGLLLVTFLHRRLAMALLLLLCGVVATLACIASAIQ